MNRGPNLKPGPHRLAFFGGNHNIGIAAAQYVQEESPQSKVRLIIRQEKHRAALEARFPEAEVVFGDYYDLSSLERALKDVQGLFVLTPDFVDELRAMTNLVYAVRANPGILHIVRLLADPPGMTEKRVPYHLKRYGGGPAIQHLLARKILEDSSLPVTLMNCAGWYMQDFTSPMFNVAISKHRMLAVPRNRRMGFIDNADAGRCAAGLLLSPNHRHIGQVYHLDNNSDVLWFDEVAALMTEVLGEEIRYDGSDETFLRINGEGMKAYAKREDADRYGLELFQFEEDNDTLWRKSDIVEYLCGRKPVRLREWLAANRDALLNGPKA